MSGVPAGRASSLAVSLRLLYLVFLRLLNLLLLRGRLPASKDIELLRPDGLVWSGLAVSGRRGAVAVGFVVPSGRGLLVGVETPAWSTRNIYWSRQPTPCRCGAPWLRHECYPV
jgi:hypothetical protein